MTSDSDHQQPARAPRLSADVLLPLPDFVRPCGEGFLEDDGQGGRYIRVDAGIVPAVQALWSDGIATRASCDGHGGDVGYVLVEIPGGTTVSPFTIFTWSELHRLHDDCEDDIDALRLELAAITRRATQSESESISLRAENVSTVEQLSNSRRDAAAEIGRLEQPVRDTEIFAATQLAARKQEEAALAEARDRAEQAEQGVRDLIEAINRIDDTFGIDAPVRLTIDRDLWARLLHTTADVLFATGIQREPVAAASTGEAPASSAGRWSDVARVRLSAITRLDQPTPGLGMGAWSEDNRDVPYLWPRERPFRSMAGRSVVLEHTPRSRGVPVGAVWLRHRPPVD